MYYFARPIEKCRYEKLYAKDEDPALYRSALSWLKKYCGFFPVLWVSNNQNALCGYTPECNHVLFGFSSIHGFPVSYEPWSYILSRLLLLDTTDANFMDGIVEEMFHPDLHEEVREEWGFTYSWHGCQDFKHFLKRNVFVPSGQFALESLDLRRASTIICREQVHRTVLIRSQYSPKVVKVSSFRTLRRK